MHPITLIALIPSCLFVPHTVLYQTGPENNHHKVKTGFNLVTIFFWSGQTMHAVHHQRLTRLRINDLVSSGIRLDGTTKLNTK